MSHQRAALGDALVPVTVTMRDRRTKAAIDLSGYDTLEVLLEDPTGSVATLAGAAGAGTGQIDATIPAFSSAGTWKVWGRARDTGTGAQRTSYAPGLIRVEAGSPA